MDTSELSANLSEALNTRLTVFELKPVHGGSINTCQVASTSEGNFFLKHNKADFAADMFRKETMGLNLLASAKALRVPNVLGQVSLNKGAVLVLEHLPEKPSSKDFWQQLGAGIARLHKLKAKLHGLAYNNYFGSAIQYNTQTQNWTDFFIQQRLTPQLTDAKNKGRISGAEEARIVALIEKIPLLLYDEEPGLLHGDLWRGNIYASGEACIVDPAVYFGHREVDLAMTTLFGGFDKQFYTAYQQEYPLEPDWQLRLPIYNLYPLLFHLNAFGREYWSRIAAILCKNSC